MTKIDSVKFGEVKVRGKVYYSDLTVWWDGKVEFRDKKHEFGMSEFLKLLEREPEIIVIGTGMDGVCRILPEAIQAAKDKRVEIFHELSPKAIEIFNAFVADERRVVAVIHSTC